MLFIWLLSLQRSFDGRYIPHSINIYPISPPLQTRTFINLTIKIIIQRQKNPGLGSCFQRSFFGSPRIILYLMKSVIRKIVAGPKKKTPFNGQELDLTYITGRIIAMAYPASSFFQKAYRNSIDDVANYFNEYHKDNFLIINISCRPYDYSKFGGRVREYEWPDHQAPPITTLVEIANQMKAYLQKKPQGVVAVHCNHGKGRTGTAIIGFMLYLALYDRAADALAVYNSRRFSDEEYGVDQPCQTRYLGFLERLLHSPKLPRRMIAYRLVTVSQQGLHDKYFLTIKKARSGENLLTKFNFGQHSKIIEKPLMGDVFIEIFEDAWSGPKKLARINYNTYFLNPNFLLNIQQLSVTFKSSEIKCSKGQDKPFTIKIQFQYYCLCHIEGSQGIECECNDDRNLQEKYWNRMVDQIQQAKSVKQEQRGHYFYCQTMKIESPSKERKSNQQAEEAYQLSINMSNIFIGDPVLMNKVARMKEEQLKKQDQVKKEQGQTSSSSEEEA